MPLLLPAASAAVLPVADSLTFGNHDNEIIKGNEHFRLKPRETAQMACYVARQHAYQLKRLLLANC